MYRGASDLDADFGHLVWRIIVVAACITFLLFFVVRATWRAVRAPRRLPTQGTGAARRIRRRGSHGLRPLHVRVVPRVCIGPCPIRNTLRAARSLFARQRRRLFDTAVRIEVVIIEFSDPIAAVLAYGPSLGRGTVRACCRSSGHPQGCRCGASRSANAETTSGASGRYGPTDARAECSSAYSLARTWGRRIGGRRVWSRAANALACVGRYVDGRLCTLQIRRLGPVCIWDGRAFEELSWDCTKMNAGNVREVTATVAARVRLFEGSVSSRRTPCGDIPCFMRVTPVNVVYASDSSEAATSF